jgi:preprotein translocase subunit SecE
VTQDAADPADGTPRGDAASSAGGADAAGTPPGRRGDATAVKDPGPFARLVRFLREVVAELRKVVRPTRGELVTYTSVVLVFVAVVMLYVSGLDYVFGQAVLWVFGGGGG